MAKDRSKPRDTHVLVGATATDTFPPDINRALGEDAELVEQVAVRVVALLRTERRGTPGWLTTDEAARRLSLGKRTLQRLMASTPPGATVPFVKIGRAVRWKEDELDEWMMEMDEWQASTGGGRSGGSAGGGSTGRSVSGRARPGRRPGASRSRSKRQSPTDETGSLVSFVKRLQSGK